MEFHSVESSLKIAANLETKYWTMDQWAEWMRWEKQQKYLNEMIHVRRIARPLASRNDIWSTVNAIRFTYEAEAWAEIIHARFRLSDILVGQENNKMKKENLYLIRPDVEKYFPIPGSIPLKKQLTA